MRHTLVLPKRQFSLVIGVLWEAWRLVQERSLGSELGKEFVPKLDPAAKKALDRLKKEFGGSNIIATVRNQYCFHYPKPEEMENAFQRALESGEMEEADWGVYFSRKLLNVFFFVSDYVFAHGLSSAITEASVTKAHEKLLMSLGPIANNLSEVAYGYAAVIFKKYLGPEMILTVAAQTGRVARSLQNTRSRWRIGIV
jgi:hypothetical protein